MNLENVCGNTKKNAITELMTYVSIAEQKARSGNASGMMVAFRQAESVLLKYGREYEFIDEISSLYRTKAEEIEKILQGTQINNLLEKAEQRAKEMQEQKASSKKRGKTKRKRTGTDGLEKLFDSIRVIAERLGYDVTEKIQEIKSKYNL